VATATHCPTATPDPWEIRWSPALTRFAAEGVGDRINI
jgi:hypothetical protein